MSINERLKLLVVALGLNNNLLANRLGVNPTVTHNILSGRMNKPSYDLLEKIVITFNNINTEWLLKEKGEMFLTDSITDDSLKEDSTLFIEYKLDEMRQINRELERIVLMYLHRDTLNNNK